MTPRIPTSLMVSSMASFCATGFCTSTGVAAPFQPARPNSRSPFGLPKKTQKRSPQQMAKRVGLQQDSLDLNMRPPPPGLRSRQCNSRHGTEAQHPAAVATVAHQDALALLETRAPCGSPFLGRTRLVKPRLFGKPTVKPKLLGRTRGETKRKPTVLGRLFVFSLGTPV